MLRLGHSNNARCCLYFALDFFVLILYIRYIVVTKIEIKNNKIVKVQNSDTNGNYEAIMTTILEKDLKNVGIFKENIKNKSNAFYKKIAEINPSFHRINVNIKNKWGSFDCDEYLLSLLIDDRPNRQGFPALVYSSLRELLALHEDYLLKLKNYQH